MNDSLVTLRTFSSRVEADIASSALDAFGIESFIRSDDCGGQRPSFQLDRGVQLMTREEDAERAEEVLTCGPESEG